MANLGFVGLGVMGGLMAQRLLEKGHNLTGYNRTRSKAQPLIDKGEVRSVHAKVGRGAAVLFDVPSNEALHAHLNAWADIIPATFQVHALIDPANARRFLDAQGAAG